MEDHTQLLHALLSVSVSLSHCPVSPVAQVLKKKGVAKTFLVTESKGLIGGNITTVKNDEGFMWEEGPNSFQPGDPMLRMTVHTHTFRAHTPDLPAA